MYIFLFAHVKCFLLMNINVSLTLITVDKINCSSAITEEGG